MHDVCDSSFTMIYSLMPCYFNDNVINCSKIACPIRPSTSTKSIAALLFNAYCYSFMYIMIYVPTLINRHATRIMKNCSNSTHACSTDNVKYFFRFLSSFCFDIFQYYESLEIPMGD